MERTIVVGDVHGCRDELQALLASCGWSARDRVVLAGDLVAKGPDSAGVVALARKLGALAVLGNHDRRVLRIREIQGGRARDDGHPVKPEHQRVVDTLSAADWAYLQALPPFLRLGPERPGEPETAVLHAGAVPGLPLEEQDRENLLCMRSIRDDGQATKKITGRPWASLWKGPERIVFGHDAVRGLQRYDWAIGLDTGCVYGGQLTAIILPERRLVSVRAARAYAQG